MRLALGAVRRDFPRREAFSAFILADSFALVAADMVRFRRCVWRVADGAQRIPPPEWAWPGWCLPFSFAEIFALVAADSGCPACGCFFPFSAALIFALVADEIGCPLWGFDFPLFDFDAPDDTFELVPPDV